MINEYSEHLRKTIEYYRERLAQIEKELEPMKTLIDEKSKLENIVKELKSDLQKTDPIGTLMESLDTEDKPYTKTNTNEAMIAWLQDHKGLHRKSEIIKGIIGGGWTTTSDNPASIVESAIARELKKKKPGIYRRDGRYGAIKKQ